MNFHEFLMKSQKTHRRNTDLQIKKKYTPVVFMPASTPPRVLKFTGLRFGVKWTSNARAMNSLHVVSIISSKLRLNILTFNVAKVTQNKFL